MDRTCVMLLLAVLTALGASTPASARWTPAVTEPPAPEPSVTESDVPEPSVPEPSAPESGTSTDPVPRRLPSRTPGPAATFPVATPAPPPSGGSPCERGEYGEVLADGTVDAGCDGVLGLAEQRNPVTLRLRTEAVADEQVTVLLDEERVAGRVLRVDEVSRRGGRIERFPVLYHAPEGLDGRDGFSLWVLRDGYEREVRAGVDVDRVLRADRAGPSRGALLGAAGQVRRVPAGTEPSAVAPTGRSWLSTLLLPVLGLVASWSAWWAVRRGAWTPALLHARGGRTASGRRPSGGFTADR